MVSRYTFRPLPFLSLSTLISSPLLGIIDSVSLSFHSILFFSLTERENGHKRMERERERKRGTEKERDREEEKEGDGRTRFATTRLVKRRESKKVFLPRRSSSLYFFFLLRKRIRERERKEKFKKE